MRNNSAMNEYNKNFTFFQFLIMHANFVITDVKMLFARVIKNLKNVKILLYYAVIIIFKYII